MSEVEAVVEDPNKYLVQINYKSGKTVEVWFDKFSVTQKNGSLQSVTWKASGDQQSIIFINMDNIESIFQIGHKLKDGTGA